MSTLRSNFLKTLTERGFIHQRTDLAGLDERLSAGRGMAIMATGMHDIRDPRSLRDVGQL
jgi:hypothetical protein